MAPNPPVGPVPIAASYNPGPPERVYVTFDQALLPGTFSRTNFSTRWANQRRGTFSAIVAPATPTILTVRLGVGAAEPGPNETSYFATLPELVAATGQPAGPYLNYPVT